MTCKGFTFDEGTQNISKSILRLKVEKPYLKDEKLNTPHIP
jgi:hypothetical protein